MPTALDPQIAYDWIHAALLADAILSHPTTGLTKGRTYIDKAPTSTTPYPMTLIQSLSNVPVVYLGAKLGQMNSVIMVKSIDQGKSYTRIRAIANRITAVLNGSMGTTSTGQVFACWLDGDDPLPDPTTEAGLDFVNRVQRFRLAFA